MVYTSMTEQSVKSLIQKKIHRSMIDGFQISYYVIFNLLK